MAFGTRLLRHYNFLNNISSLATFAADHIGHDECLDENIMTETNSMCPLHGRFEEKLCLRSICCC